MQQLDAQRSVAFFASKLVSSKAQFVVARGALGRSATLPTVRVGLTQKGGKLHLSNTNPGLLMSAHNPTTHSMRTLTVADIADDYISVNERAYAEFIPGVVN